MPKAIGSVKDNRIRLARELKTRKGRVSHGKVLLECEQILDWAIERGVSIEFVLVTDPPAADLVEKCAARDIELFVVSDGIQKFGPKEVATLRKQLRQVQQKCIEIIYGSFEGK